MSNPGPDGLHRLIKLAMDTGEAESVEHAREIFAGYRLGIEAGPEIARSPSHQAAMLTLLRLASRVFHGGVDVVCAGIDELPNLISEDDGIAKTLREVGARVVPAFDSHIPVVQLGTAAPVSRESGFAIRAVFDGWRAGIVPVTVPLPFEFSTEMPLAGVLSAALAINEAFLFVRRDFAEAGFRTLGLSLWRPDAIESWSDERSDGPCLTYLPSKLWFIGLGHLGQAYLWALSLLPYTTRKEVLLVLQDVDVITQSTLSTSVLSDAGVLGQMKTRAMASAMENRGFRTSIVERKFDETTRVLPDDPAIALCGLDNATGRRCLADAGWELVVEAGLGSGAKDFRSMRIHTFPSTKTPRELWAVDEAPPIQVDKRAYDDLRNKGLDQCGVTLLAGRAVGAPFVGMTAAALGLSEILRLLHDGSTFAVHDLDLRNPQARLCVERTGVTPFNPGFVRARAGVANGC